MEILSNGDTMVTDNLTGVCSEDTPVFCFGRTVPIAITLGVISIVTVIGNIFVLVAYTTDYHIRSTVANTFILNLSICDLIVGAVSIPMNSIWVIVGRWPFGKLPCQIWLVLDYTATNVAVLTIIFISLDRYWLLTKKLAYTSFQTHKRAAIMNVVGWIVCTVFYTIVAFAWGPIAGVDNVDYNEECELEPFENGPFVAFQLVMEFIIPLLIIIYLNAMVYMNIKQRSKGKFRNSEKSCEISVTTASGGVGTNKTEGNSYELTSSANKLNRAKRTQLDLDGAHSNTGFDHQLEDINIVLDADQSPVQLNLASERGKHAKTTKNKTNGLEVAKRGNASSGHRVHRARELKRHRKAAITLSVLVSVFVATWLPFNVSSLLAAFCEGCTSEVVWDVVNCLLWCNSTLNPFLYALLSVRFRQNFSRYLGLNLCMKRS